MGYNGYNYGNKRKKGNAKAIFGFIIFLLVVCGFAFAASGIIKLPKLNYNKEDVTRYFTDESKAEDEYERDKGEFYTKYFTSDKENAYDYLTFYIFSTRYDAKKYYVAAQTDGTHKLTSKEDKYFIFEENNNKGAMFNFANLVIELPAKSSYNGKTFDSMINIITESFY